MSDLSLNWSYCGNKLFQIVPFVWGRVIWDHQGEVYLGAGGLIRPSKVRTGSCLGAVGRGIWGACEVCISSVCGPILLNADVWGRLGSLFVQSETGLKWYLRESLACRWQVNLCLQMRSPATTWQVFIFNVVLMLGWLMSMHNFSTVQHYMEVSRSPETPLARQDCSLLLLMKLLWTAGSNGCEEVALYSSVKSNILNSLVTEDGNCDNGYFLGYKDILYFLKASREHC